MNPARCMDRFLCTPVLLLLLAAGTLRAAEDFAARFQKAKAAQDTTQTAAILDEWKRAQPDDPKYYIAAANDLLDRESGPMISTKQAGPGDFVVTDEKTGRPVGSFGPRTPPPEANRKAVELLKQGLSKAPARMDNLSRSGDPVRAAGRHQGAVGGPVGDGGLRQHPSG